MDDLADAPGELHGLAQRVVVHLAFAGRHLEMEEQRAEPVVDRVGDAAGEIPGRALAFCLEQERLQLSELAVATLELRGAVGDRSARAPRPFASSRPSG